YPFLSACRVASPRSHSFPTRRSSDLCPPSRSWLRRQHPAVRGSGVRVAVRGHLVVPSAALSLLHSPNPGPIRPGPDQSGLRSVRALGRLLSQVRQRDTAWVGGIVGPPVVGVRAVRIRAGDRRVRRWWARRVGTVQVSAPGAGPARRAGTLLRALGLLRVCSPALRCRVPVLLPATSRAAHRSSSSRAW